MGKAIRTLGYILLAAGGALILAAQVSVYREHGLSALLAVMSPREFLYFNVMAAVALAPGVVLTTVGERLVTKPRRRRRSSYLSDFAIRC